MQIYVCKIALEVYLLDAQLTQIASLQSLLAILAALKNPCFGKIGSKNIFSIWPLRSLCPAWRAVEGEKPKRVSWPIDTLPLTFDDKEFLLEKSTFFFLFL